MTDQITDQDCREARKWAEGFLSEPGVRGSRATAAARVILATVDAPAPTLAEELMDWSRKVFLDEGGKKTMRDYSERAKQMERDLAEARAEVKVLAEELAGAESEVERLTAVAEDYARRATAALTERDEARAEVECLTAERDRLEAAQYLSDGSAWGGPVREPTVQKGAESNAETTDPADVKPGEAWIVECRGERRNAVKGRADDLPWSTIDANGRHVYKRNKNVTLITRLVPAPRVITNPDELDALPDDTIVRIDEGGDAMRKYKGKWHPTSNECCYESQHIALPATVLWEPEA